MANFEKCDDDIHQRVVRIRDKFHAELRDAGVTVLCLWARAASGPNGDKAEVPLRLHGKPCAAIVNVVNQKDRAAGLPDARILIDGDRWDTWCVEKQNALLDHELTHLQLKTDAKGLVKRDDLDRPMLKLKLHDYDIAGFDVIARRYGEHSFEMEQVQIFADEFGQTLMPWAHTPKQFKKSRADRN